MNQQVVPTTGVTPPVGLPSGAPTYDGFVWFVQNVMQVPSTALPPYASQPIDPPPPDPILQTAYDQAINLAYWGLGTIPSQPTSPSIYAMAVYNLGCALLLEFAPDNTTTDPPGTFWSDLRSKLGINSASFGIINAAADQGTSEASYIPETIKNMTLLDLQLMKSPWGRMYLMIAGEWGTIWGLTL